MQYVEVIINSGVQVVETAGRPPGEFIEEFKKNGIKIIHKCVTTRHAKSAEKMGADAISLDGFECAGHPGEEDIGNFILQAMGARDLTVPYVASGGVATGRQLAAALTLGASGVNMGVRFMATKEAPIHDNIKQAIVKGTVSDSTLVMRSVKNTERVYKNDVVLKVQQLEQEFPGDFSKIHQYVKGLLQNYFLQTLITIALTVTSRRELPEELSRDWGRELLGLVLRARHGPDRRGTAVIRAEWAVQLTDRRSVV